MPLNIYRGEKVEMRKSIVSIDAVKKAHFDKLKNKVYRSVVSLERTLGISVLSETAKTRPLGKGGFWGSDYAFSFASIYQENGLGSMPISVVIIPPVIEGIGRTVLVPYLRYDVNVAIAIHITQHGFMESRIVNLEHHRLKDWFLPGAYVLPDHSSLLHPRRLHGQFAIPGHIGIGIFLLTGEDVQIAVVVKIGHAQRVKRACAGNASGSGWGIGELVSLPLITSALVLNPVDVGIAGVAVAIDDIVFAVVIHVNDP
jgi:hypothetical protein